MNANVMKTQIFHKTKCTFKGRGRSGNPFSQFFLAH